VWPIALYERIAPREEASSWYRFQMRQALWFGLIASGIGIAALFWPLLASFVITNVAATIWLYVLAMLVDIGLFVVWLVLAMRYNRRAARGELFDVPWVVRLTGASSQKR
jgi:MFS family permease